MKYEKPIMAAVPAVKAIQGTGGANKPTSNHTDQSNPFLQPTAGAYEADE